MDPLTIIASVVKITTTCVSASLSLSELRTKYNDAPMTIVAICSETTLISASLSKVQELVLRRHDLTNVLNARPDLAAALDTTLIGCAVLFSCLHEETQHMTQSSTQPSQYTWWKKAKVMWNHDRLKELLDGLRGQQTAISTIINLLQVDSLEDLKQMLQQNKDIFVTTTERTRSFRKSIATMNVPNSIYDGDKGERSIYPSAVSAVAPSDIEFDFDDQIVNSKVYRRTLAQAMSKTMVSDVKAIESHVIDSSNATTIKEVAIQQEETSSAVPLPEDLVIPQRQQNELGKEHVDTLASKFRLAKRLHKQQKYIEAEELFRESAQEREKVGKEHVNTLDSKFWLACTLYHQQKYTEAEELFQESALGREKVLGKEDIDTLTSKWWLARTLYHQQKYTKAEELLRESAQEQERVLGKGHVHTLDSKDSLARTLLKQQKYMEAEEQFRDLAQEDERVVGKEHVYTLNSKDWLAQTLYHQQKYTEAGELFRELAQQREKVLGKEHVRTLNSKDWLAKTLHKQQKYASN